MSSRLAIGAGPRRLTLLLLLLEVSCSRGGFAPVTEDRARAETGQRSDASPVLDGRPADGLSDRPSCVPAMTQLAVLGDVDDGEILEDGSYLLQGEPPVLGDPAGIYMGWWSETGGGTGLTWGFFRFALTKPLPAATGFLRAELTLAGLASPLSSAGWDATAHALLVGLEDSKDAAPVVSGADCPGIADGRPLIGSVRWPAAGGLTWKTSGDNTVELGAALKQLAGKQGGLVAGAHVQLWVRGAAKVKAELATPDSSSPGSKPARLTLTWCP